MKQRKLAYLLGLFASFLITSQAIAEQHFYVQMENRTEGSVGISFQQAVGNIYLDPVLADYTPLAAHQASEKYGVHIEPLDPKSTFNIVFTGKKDCTFNVAFYAPGRPKITSYGLGCYGGGYQLIDNGATLLLFVTDIKKS